MIYLGVDPDTHATGVCALTTESGYDNHRPDFFSFFVVRGEGAEIMARVEDMARNFSHLRGLVFDEAAIEWQALRPGREKNPNAMMAVMAAAGMALATIRPLSDGLIHLPVPSKWKGTVPKEVDQARTLADARLTLDSVEFAHVPKKYRTHCVDALGLCLWMKRGRVLRSQA